MTEGSAVLRSEVEVRTLIDQIVLELAPAAARPEGRDVKLVDELEYTSLALLELAFTLEDEFELPPIDEATAQTIVVVGDVEDYVVNGLREQGQLAE